MALVMTCLFTLPSVSHAGRDAGQIDMQNRAYKSALQDAASQAAGPVASSQQQALPLNHGPRAVTTSWQSKELLQRQKSLDTGSGAHASASTE
jgi:hypothetical protein